jgi:hypothetical protein
MRKLTDGERDVLAELQAEGQAIAGMLGDWPELSDDERGQIEAEIWAEIDRYNAARHQSH